MDSYRLAIPRCAQDFAWSGESVGNCRLSPVRLAEEALEFAARSRRSPAPPLSRYESGGRRRRGSHRSEDGRPRLFSEEGLRLCRGRFAEPLFEFWRQARRREVKRVYLSSGSLAENRLCAPVAVYRARLFPRDDSVMWLFIQHGSYQWISLAEQPHLEEGYVLLHRGIQREKTFRYPSLERDL